MTLIDIQEGVFDTMGTEDEYNLRVAVDWIQKAMAGTLATNYKISAASIQGTLTLTGSATIGDTSADTLTVNATSDFIGPTTFTGVVTMTAAATTNKLDIVGAAITTGKAIDISDLAAITTGKAIHIDATGITQTDGILVHIDSASTAITSTGRLLLVDHTGAAGVSNINSEFKSAAADETTIVQITASAALAAGAALTISAASMTTGIALNIANLDALTSGTGIKLYSNSADATARVLLDIKNDHASATGVTPLRIVQDAPTTTNYFKAITIGTFTIWYGNETSPNAALSGTKGDILLNGSATGQAFWCTGTTNWTALA